MKIIDNKMHDEVSDYRLLSTHEVLDIIGFGKTWLDENIAAGKFPAPKKEGRVNKWRAAWVKRWVKENYPDHPKYLPNPAKAGDALQ